MTAQVATGFPLDNHRTTPIPTVWEPAKAVAATGDIDYLWFWDEVSGWFPGQLCGSASTPAADFIDPNSTYDPFVDATPLSMSRKSFHVGTPAEMSVLNAQFVEPGARFVGWLDMTPPALGPAEGGESLRRFAGISAAIKNTETVSA